MQAQTRPTGSNRQAPDAPPTTRSAAPAWRTRVPRLLAWVVRIAAAVPLLDVLRSEHDRYPSVRLDLLADAVTILVAVLASAAMIFLAGGLARRKRRAWVLMLAVISVGTLAHVTAGHTIALAVNLALLAALIWARRDFTAASDARGRLMAVRVFLVMAPVSFVAGMLLTRRTAPGSSFWQRCTEVFFGLLGFAPDVSFARGRAATLTEDVLNGLGALTALLVLVAFLAPVRRRPGVTPEDETRVRDLLAGFGGQDSLGYFALRPDKCVLFSPSGKAAVAYRVVGSVSLAAGDPLGDVEAWPGAISAWLADADRHAWVPGVIGASEQGAIAYARAGMDALELGDEAVLGLSEFTLDGRAMRAVRQGVNRVQRAGYTLDVRRQHDVPEAELAEAAQGAEQLREEEVERGFSMALGRVGDPRDPDVVLARVRDGEGRLVAVLTFVPWGGDGLSLDVMRRARDSENGTVEFAVTGVAAAAGDLGVARISLNFAVFRSVFERGTRVGAGPVTRLWRRILLFGSRWWQIESLYRANAKYHPEWLPRFVCFRVARELPRVAVAMLEAEAFVARPRWRWLGR